MFFCIFVGILTITNNQTMKTQITYVLILISSFTFGQENKLDKIKEAINIVVQENTYNYSNYQSYKNESYRKINSLHEHCNLYFTQITTELINLAVEYKLSKPNPLKVDKKVLQEKLYKAYTDKYTVFVLSTKSDCADGNIDLSKVKILTDNKKEFKLLRSSPALDNSFPANIKGLLFFEKVDNINSVSYSIIYENSDSKNTTLCPFEDKELGLLELIELNVKKEELRSYSQYSYVASNSSSELSVSDIIGIAGFVVPIILRFI